MMSQTLKCDILQMLISDGVIETKFDVDMKDIGGLDNVVKELVSPGQCILIIEDIWGLLKDVVVIFIYCIHEPLGSSASYTCVRAYVPALLFGNQTTRGTVQISICQAYCQAKLVAQLGWASLS